MFMRKTMFAIRNDKFCSMKFVILAKINFKYVNFYKEKIVFTSLYIARHQCSFQFFLSFTKRNVRGL